MLPILAKKRDAGGIASTLTQDREPDTDSDSDDSQYSLEDCAKDILAAVHANDHEMLADALREAIQTAQNEPSADESEAPSPHTYDAQNQLAGKE